MSENEENSQSRVKLFESLVFSKRKYADLSRKPRD